MKQSLLKCVKPQMRPSTTGLPTTGKHTGGTNKQSMTSSQAFKTTHCLRDSISSKLTLQQSMGIHSTSISLNLPTTALTIPKSGLTIRMLFQTGALDSTFTLLSFTLHLTSIRLHYASNKQSGGSLKELPFPKQTN